MLRILLPAALLATALFAAQPASAANLCDAIAYSPYYDQTLNLGCDAVDCYFTTPAPQCVLSHPGAVLGYALCYGTTGPLYWAPACT
jgi:hypothetical protein